ncbi:MAG: energy-coupling factor transporter transmembrane protein EcfT [Propionibacteriaceae bacterium]|nr:energy-coupling factor transporter transmembrane protein EcfT [Propionibacteriaceae bacterium]
MLSLYVPGDSLIHRTPAWLKLLVLCVCGTAVMIIPSPVALAVGLALVVVSYAVAGIGVRVVWRASRAILVFVVVITAFQWLFSSWALALVVGERILFLVAAANLLTVTTTMSDLIATVESLLTPFARWGVRPDRAGIAIALALRFIPTLVEQGALIREAQAARGVKAPFTYLAPLIIRALRMADGVGEALEARGLGAAPVRPLGATGPDPGATDPPAIAHPPTDKE